MVALTVTIQAANPDVTAKAELAGTAKKPDEADFRSADRSTLLPRPMKLGGLS